MAESRELVVSVTMFGRELVAIRLARAAGTRSRRPPARPRRRRRTVPPSKRNPLYLVSSLLLHDAFRVLTQTPDENLHAVTGLVCGRRRILQRIVPLRLSLQSRSGAAADDTGLAEQLVRLNGFGALPLAYFHSHPGRGVEATAPSGTDLKTQKTMERSGSKIIGGIFSRDGVVRFYAAGWEPCVRVVGKRVEEVQKNVYRLLPEEDVQA